MVANNLETNESLLALAKLAWSKAKVLHRFPNRLGEPEALCYARQLSSIADLEIELVSLLNDEKQLVVAYTLLTLELMNSSAIGDLPGDLLKRTEKLTIYSGSFANKMELGAYARHLQKKWRTKHNRKGGQ